MDNKLIDHLFRSHAGQMVATLTRFLGADNLELAENAVSESMLKAMNSWSIKGVPDNPKAWLYRVAKNYAIDELRRKKTENEKVEIIEKELDKIYELEDEDPYIKPVLQDDRLKMIFLCCHPLLNSQEQVAMALKMALGLGVREISKSFLIPVKTLEQRLVRAKKKLREGGAKFELPEKEKVLERVDNVYSTLYLLFNEGYSATEGENLTVNDLCEDAIKLLTLVLSVKDFDFSKGRALMAIFYLQSSRLDSRIDENGEIVLLEDQDRSKWNQEYIQMGLKLLMLSAQGSELSKFHIEAKIAATHSTAESFEKTDWKSIVSDYANLYKLNPNPIYKLNKAVAYLMDKKVEMCLDLLHSLQKEKVFKEYHFFYCALGEAYLKKGDIEMSKKFYKTALSLAKTVPEQKFIKNKITNY